MADQTTASDEGPAEQPEQEVKTASEQEATTAVARRPSVQIEEAQTMNAVAAWGRLMAASGFFKDAQNEAQAAVKILAGRELGFGVIESMTGIFIIENRPTLSAGLMANAVKRSGRYDYRVLEHTEQHCLIEFRQRVEGGGWERLGASEFSVDDAERAGLMRPGSNWTKYPRNMVFARAMSNGVRFHCPDVFGQTVYTPEEIRPEMELSPDGEIIDIASVAIAPPQQGQRQQQQRDPQPERERQGSRPAGGQRSQRGGQPAASAQPAAPAGERKPPPSKMGPDDWKLVRSLQTLMTWAHEAYGKVQRDVTGTLGLATLPDISAKYQTSEDYQEAVLELLHEWDIERYTRWMDEQVNGPLADGSAEDTDAEVDADEQAASEYDADASGPEDATVEIGADGTILVGGEPAEPLP